MHIDPVQSQASLFVHSEWFPSELALLQPPEELTTAEHAERHRYVIKSARPGPWRNENNPPLVGIMNIADRKGVFRNVRVLAVCKGVQTGGSEAVYNILFKRMDGSANTALLVMENERKVRRVSRQRILENIKRHRRLSEQLSDNPDDTTNYSVIMRTGFCLNIGWAGSQAAVASDPCETVVLDETDKYEIAMNIEEAKDRITTYTETGLAILNSTPGIEGGPIVSELAGCDTVMDFYAECPDCGALQVMDFERFWWPGKGEPLHSPDERKRLANRVLRDKLARYACLACGVLWDDYGRDRAVRFGARHNFHGWKMREEVPNPVSIGIHFPSWISPFKSLSHVVARRIKAEGDPAKTRAWHNQEAAEAYAEKVSERKEDAILALKDDRPRGVVPRDTACLVLLIDTQQKGFYYEVAALGWGSSLPSWQVREGFVETFAGLKDVLYNSEYRDADGARHVIQYAFIDSGGGTGTVPKHSRTAEVYEFCRLNPAVRPLKGRQTMATTVSQTKLDFYPGTKTPIPGGIMLHLVNVTFFKDQLAGKLAIAPDDPGAWRLHAEATEDYARQMTAEYKDERGRWQCPKGRANHYWDLGVYRLAAAEILQVKFWKRPEDGGRQAGRRVVSKGVQN